jgi:hypothetical protein
MLKSLLLSGWFRVQPYSKYVIAVILIAPLVGISIHSSVAKQSQVKLGKTNLGLGTSDPKSCTELVAGEQDLITSKVNSLKAKLGTVLQLNKAVNEEKKILLSDKVSTGAEQEHQQSIKDAAINESLTEVETEDTAKLPNGQINLIRKLREAKARALGSNTSAARSQEQELITSATDITNIRETKTSLITEIPVEEAQQLQTGVAEDPMGSPHPIPWKWITTTQETIGGSGRSGVRHYRSIPVISPDGRYAVYSRVQLEVRPEMHNSRVTSLLFLEDRQTKRLRVMSKTADINDPLLTQAVTVSDTDYQGKIGVLVPVSWSQKGDRFLARKFVGVFNTADVTDHAVIWERQANVTKTVAPVQTTSNHERISILLGWSKQQPDNVLFRTGELGEDNWPLVQVSSDGTTINLPGDDDQPVTFGERDQQIWSEPQVASR